MPSAASGTAVTGSRPPRRLASLYQMPTMKKRRSPSWAERATTYRAPVVAWSAASHLYPLVRRAAMKPRRVRTAGTQITGSCTGIEVTASPTEPLVA